MLNLNTMISPAFNQLQELKNDRTFNQLTKALKAEHINPA